MSRRLTPQSADFLLLDSGAAFSGTSVHNGHADPSTKMLDQYDLPGYDLENANHKILVMDEFIDQELMMEQKDKIKAFLDRGNILFFAGHLFRDWIPGASMFVPKTVTSYLDYVVTIQEHPIFDGVTSEDITYTRGVAGFFCRGHHPIPEGAEVLLELTGGIPITYIDRTSTNGTILLHAGRNLLKSRDTGNSSGRIGEQLYKWLYEEHEAIRMRGVQA
ncbi:phosphate starvation-inducible protein PhoH [Paenibacillus spongiae]|uniref:Phosphate starvation-inducible protein PhoH n=1 Tax=Paenibacillus spongiae TaxID=2909671 RepID=A0ABY5S2E5_9BACL|nr:phosphate starvation-inducible protein PhoH [Paenibacillus spongiae]UVI28037.1 phosphate starvation-inducible protein PhoH [Paenibacillus spongiae]